MSEDQPSPEIPPRRFPGWVYRGGSEPDPRFSLANERTFLAWIRTSLALLAGGVALEALRIPPIPGVRTPAAVLLLLLGLIAAIQAWVGWARAEHSLRNGRPLSGTGFGAVIVVGIVVVAVVILIGTAL